MSIPIPSTWWEVLVCFVVSAVALLILIRSTKEPPEWQRDESEQEGIGCAQAPLMLVVQIVFLATFIAAFWGAVRLIEI